MYGAFIGDIVGSKYEFNAIKTKQFPLFSDGCYYTDDTNMTVAVEKAILLSVQSRLDVGNYQEKNFKDILIEVMKDFTRRYPHQTSNDQQDFTRYLFQKFLKPQGRNMNGSIMCVSPCGLIASTMEEALVMAQICAKVTHNHIEDIKGAQAVSVALFLVKNGKSKEEIREYISRHYYHLDFHLEDIRKKMRFERSSQSFVAQAIMAFLECESFEDAIRNAVSLGGDSDTMGAIAGSLAWTYYDRLHIDDEMMNIKNEAMSYLPKEFIEIADIFHEFCDQRDLIVHQTGKCIPILSEEELLNK